MIERIKVFDTTLRDGEQGIGYAMNLLQKEHILEKLDHLGVDMIELGMPAASQEDFDWCKKALSRSLKTPVCLFSRLNHHDLSCILQLAREHKFHVQLLGVGSEIHLEKKRRLTAEQSLAELNNSIQYLQDHGVNDISVIFEDATRGSYRWLTELTLLCVDRKVGEITLADTLGSATPDKIKEMVTHIKHLMPDTMTLGVHCHNDLGLAVANTLSAVQAGANIIQTTLGGIGERAGNCALEEIFSVLHFGMSPQTQKINLNPILLRETADFVFSELGKNIASNKPILGEHVFSTAAGIHQDGLIKDKSVYEHVRPETFGRKGRMLFNRLSGRKFLKYLLGHREINVQMCDKFYQYLIAKNTQFNEAEILQEFDHFIHEKKASCL